MLAVDALYGHRARMMAQGPVGAAFVFVTKAGTPYRKSNFIRQSFKPLLKQAVLPESVRFHDLRHTAATLMLLEGIRPKIVQERLGHATISMTLDIYSHVLPSMQADAAEKTGRILSIA